MIQGSCFCGTVQYEFTPPSKFVANCHCSECRRTSGAAFVTWIGTWEKHFTVTRGKDQITRFAYEPKEEATREFCKKCGSQLFFRYEPTFPGEIHVTLGTVTSKPDRAVQADVFYSDKADWFDPHAKLPKLGGPTGLEKLDP